MSRYCERDVKRPHLASVGSDAAIDRNLAKCDELEAKKYHATGHKTINNITTTKETVTTLINNTSCKLIIPKGMAEKHGIHADSKVVIEDTGSGLLLRKLELYMK